MTDVKTLILMSAAGIRAESKACGWHLSKQVSGWSWSESGGHQSTAQVRQSQERNAQFDTHSRVLAGREDHERLPFV